MVPAAVVEICSAIYGSVCSRLVEREKLERKLIASVVQQPELKTTGAEIIISEDLVDPETLQCPSFDPGRYRDPGQSSGRERPQIDVLVATVHRPGPTQLRIGRSDDGGSAVGRALE